MSEERIVTGKLGEELAANFLKKKRFEIIERNYRRRFGEIDIIAMHRKTLVFIEVKTRKSKKFGSPFEAITNKKQQQIARVAQNYLCQKEMFDKPARFDVVAITLLEKEKPIIEIIQNAFDLPSG